MLRIGLMGLLAGLSSTTPARADIVVIGTNSPGIDIGTVMTNDQTLELPEGASVRIMAPSGKTQSLSGPLTTSVQELTGTTPADSSLWESVKAQYTSRDVDLKLEGKTRGLAAKPAAPAAAPKPSAAPYKFSWVSVPVFADGDVCVDKGAKLSLIRASSAKVERIVVVDMLGGGKRSEAIFAAGSNQVPWPADLEPRTGTFVFQAPDQPIRQIKLRLIAPLPNADDAVRVLHGQRCELQRNALLEALKDPAFQISSLGP